MKFSTFALMLSASLLAACSQGKPKLAKPAAVGFWEGETVASGSFFSSATSVPEYAVTEKSVSFTNHCFDGAKMVALTATSPSRLEDGKIIVEKTDVKTSASGDISCEARVDKGEIPYEIKDGKLVLTIGKGDKISFKRTSGPKAQRPIDYSQAGDEYAPGFSFRPLN